MPVSNPTTDYTLTDQATSTSVDVTVPLNGAQNWRIVIENTGAATVTGVTMALSAKGTHYGPASSSYGTIAAGTSMEIAGSAEFAENARLTITCGTTTTVTVTAQGR